MYYYGARYYEPRISIFVSVDPLAEQTMTPYQYVNNNPVNLIDPTGMSKEQEGGGWWSKMKSFLGMGSSNKQVDSPIPDTVLDEVVIPTNSKKNWFQRNFSKDKLTNDSKNIKENTGLNHFVNWFQKQDYSGGFYFYDDEKKGKGDQSLRKTSNKNIEEINVSGIMRAATFSKSMDRTNFKYNDTPLTLEKFAKITNSLLTGYNNGKAIPESNIQIPKSIKYEVESGGINGLGKVIYQTATGTYKDTVVPIGKVRGAVQALYRRDQRKNK